MCVLALLIGKAALFAYYQQHEEAICYRCILGFEAAMLFIFAVITILLYVVAVVLTCCTRRDEEMLTRYGALMACSYGNLYPSLDEQPSQRRRCLITTGMLLIVFVSGYILLFWMLIAVITSADRHQLAARQMEPSAYTKIVDWVLLLTGAHALLNPLIYVLREQQVS